jgi:hypothetical protein
MQDDSGKWPTAGTSKGMVELGFTRRVKGIFFGAKGAPGCLIRSVGLHARRGRMISLGKSSTTRGTERGSRRDDDA